MGDVAVTVANPFSLPINITDYTFRVEFDDTDGTTILAPANDITIGTVNTTLVPAQNVAAQGTHEFIDGLSLGLVTAARLLDELTKDQLVVDFLDGEVGVNVGDFGIRLLNYQVLQVPINSSAQTS